MATLTRAQMLEIIQRGESVMLPDGTIHWQEHTLPSEADLTFGDEERVKAAKQGIEDQIAALTREKAKLDNPQAAAPKDVFAPSQAERDLAEREEALRLREENFAREVAARQSVSDDAAAEEAARLEKEREERAKAEAKAAAKEAKEAAEEAKANDGNTHRSPGRPPKKED